MKLVLLTTIALLSSSFLAISTAAQTSRKFDDRTKSEIRTVLDTQRDAWNRGDIEGYMDGYERSVDTVFVSGDKVTHGWQTVLDHYKTSYDTREKMGTLTFSDLEITLLGSGSAVVLGRWRLKRTNDEPHGTFSLIFKRGAHGWRIIHDHTSSAQDR